jgi:hypothetical protein
MQKVTALHESRSRIARLINGLKSALLLSAPLSFLNKVCGTAKQVQTKVEGSAQAAQDMNAISLLEECYRKRDICVIRPV